MDLEQLLAQILGGGQAPVNRMAGNWNGPDAEPNRLMQPALPVSMAPQGAPPAAMQAQGAPMAVQQQQAPVAAPQASGGGFLDRLFGGQSSGENQTIAWLQQQGMDPGTATMMAKHKPSLQAFLLERSQGKKPIEINGKLIDPTTYEVIRDFSDPKAPANRPTAVIDGKVVDTNTGQVVGDYGDPDVQTRNMSPEEVTAAGLAPGVYQIDKDNNIKKAGDAARTGGAFRFEGTSVEAQALNGLMDSGALDADQAQQLAAGKTVTNPADGSIIFLTPRGIFSQPATGGAAHPLGPAGPAPERSAVPSVPPVVSTAPAAVVPPPAAAIPSPAAVAPPAAVNPTAPAARQGVIQLTEGKPGKLATEAETRNRSLYTVAAPDLKIALDNFGALENVYSQAASKVLPWGLDNAATSPEYQRARNALVNIIQTYMYSTSGASAPDAEVERNIKSLMPGPNEAPASIADKKARLSTMVDAIRQAGGNWTPPAANGATSAPPGTPAPGGVDPSAATPDSSGWREVVPGVKLRRVN